MDYQSLLGLTSINGDSIKAQEVITETLDAKTVTTQELVLPTNASLGKVLTSNEDGEATWQDLPPIALSGDASGPTSNTVVNTLAGGTVPVNTLVTLNDTQTLTNKTSTAPKICSISNSGTLTVPTSTDTLVGRNTTDTLTNKTLTIPKISSISNSGTLTLPTSTDTLVGRATADTLTNKTITGITNTVEANRMRNGNMWTVSYGGSVPATDQVLTYNGTNAIWKAPTSGTSQTYKGNWNSGTTYSLGHQVTQPVQIPLDSQLYANTVTPTTIYNSGHIYNGLIHKVM